MRQKETVSVNDTQRQRKTESLRDAERKWREEEKSERDHSELNLCFWQGVS